MEYEINNLQRKEKNWYNNKTERIVICLQYVQTYLHTVYVCKRLISLFGIISIVN